MRLVFASWQYLRDSGCWEAHIVPFTLLRRNCLKFKIKKQTGQLRAGEHSSDPSNWETGGQISEFGVSLIYKSSPRTVRVTQGNPVSEKKKQTQKANPPPKKTSLGSRNYYNLLYKISLSFSAPTSEAWPIKSSSTSVF